MAPLALHDVADAQALVGAVITRSGLSLSADEHEDLAEYLLVELWKLSLRYEPGAGRFSSYATGILKRRVVDWKRSRYGRTRWQFAGYTYERPRPQVVSLDDPDHDRLGET